MHPFDELLIVLAILLPLCLVVKGCSEDKHKEYGDFRARGNRPCCPGEKLVPDWPDVAKRFLNWARCIQRYQVRDPLGALVLPPMFRSISEAS